MQFIRRQAIDVEPIGHSKIAAALVIKGNIISVGKNRNKTHPMQSKYGKNKFGKNKDSIHLHAEVSTIVNSLNHVSKEDLKNATMYIHRVKRPGPNSKQWIDGIAKPCSSCMSAIAAFNIKKVVYSTENQDHYESFERFRCD
jgi:tRNA(Arg) A34 adenosine deaminase TadA